MGLLEQELLAWLHPARCLSRGKSFQFGNDAERIEKVGEGKLGDLQSLPSARNHEPACRQPLQGFANRGAGNAVLFRQLTLVEAISRPAAPFQDLSLETVNDLG
jgi:hypothetical protein